MTAADLEAAERAQHVQIRIGDLLFVRVGHRRRRDELGAWDAAQARAGLHPTTLSLLAERGIAALGSDGNNDTAPSTTAGIDFPIHVLAINAMGLHLLDYLQFEKLVPLCGGGPLDVPVHHRPPATAIGNRIPGQPHRHPVTMNR